MAGSKGKPKSAARAKRKKPARAGMPAPESITGVEEFQTAKGTLRIIHTTERDEYDPVPPPPAQKTD